MLRRDTSPFDEWWFSDSTAPAPGVIVPFVGAGISMDQPTGLPGAVELTEALMRHMLDAHVADELLGIFDRRKAVLGRKVPRLEALLSRAVSVDSDAVRLLHVFENTEPNCNHRLIAHHLVRSQGWAITTNFDDTIERASGYRIPVHVLDPERGCIRTLYGGPDASWGLIKLHGTIGSGAQGLAATIEQLTPGLHQALRELLDRALAGADMVVVAGYSGSDHFDINAHLRLKMNDKYRARLMWIEHRQESCALAEGLGTLGFRTFESAFSALRVSAGPTPEILRSVLGDFPETVTQATGSSWRQGLRMCGWVPSDAMRHRIGAALTAQMGFATLARECIAKIRHELEDDDLCVLDEARACHVEGYWRSAYALFRSREHIEADRRVQAADVLRMAGHPMRALALYARSPSLASSPFGNYVFTAILLDVCRLVLRWPRSVRKPFVTLLNRWINKRLSTTTVRLGRDATSFLKSHYQLLQLRRGVYSGLYEMGKLWLFIHEEISYPDFYTDRGPLIPGCYLLCASTAAELDLLPELLDVRLQYVDLLVLQLQNEYGAVLDGRFDASSRMWVEIACRVVKEQLGMAGEIAQMLDEDHALTRVARAWVEVDRALGGLHRWKQQRLYLPARRSRRKRLEMA